MRFKQDLKHVKSPVCSTLARRLHTCQWLAREEEKMNRFIGIVCAGLLFCVAAPPLAQANSILTAAAGVCAPIDQQCGTLLRPESPPFSSNTSQTLDGSTATTSFTLSRPTIGSTDPTLQNPFSLTSMNAFAAADSGGLRASAAASSQAFVPGGQIGCGSTCVAGANDGIASFAFASLFLDDVVISGPAATSIPVSLNLSLNGTIDTHTVASVASQNATSSIAGNDLQVAGFCGGSGEFSQSSFNGNTTSITSSGVLTGFLGTGTLGVTTPTCSEPVGTPFGVSLAMLTQSSAGIQASSDLGNNSTGAPPQDLNVLAHSLTDFSHTLSFATSGPVFNLPAGYTINSVSGNIVNNQFVGGVPPISTVPEPGSLLLLGTGLLGMAGAARRKWLG
jgi:hypothetical protein